MIGQKNLYKLGIGVYAIWQIYYSYWWFAIHKNDIRIYRNKYIVNS